MNAIKAFSGQSGVEVLMPTDAVKSIRTNAVRGSMSPREALEKMVEGTGLTVIHDEKTGALGLRANPTTDKKGEATDQRCQVREIHGAWFPYPAHGV